MAKLVQCRRELIENTQYYCQCGCNKEITVKPYYKYNGVPSYINGHNLRLVPKEKRAYAQSDETRKKRSESLKGRIPWNKGLKDCFSDETIKMWSGNRKGITTWSKGKKLGQLSEEHKRNISNGQPTKGKSKYKDPNYNLEKYCKCGCEEKITIAEHHRYNNIPDYIVGHQSRDMSEDTINKIKEKRKYQILPVKNSSIEVALQTILNDSNIKFETHKAIKGQPDIFIEPNICIFADGDYWHANPIKYKKQDIIIGSKTASDIWKKDSKITNELQEKGYKVLRFWEFDIKNKLQDCLYTIRKSVQGDSYVF